LFILVEGYAKARPLYHRFKITATANPLFILAKTAIRSVIRNGGERKSSSRIQIIATDLQ
jgi:hypothetical protein